MTDTQGSEASENESLLRLYRKLVHHLRDTRQPASEWWRGHAAEISVLKRKAPRLYAALQAQLDNVVCWAADE